MSANTQANPTDTREVFLSPAALLGHWQGHRRLTRRTAQAFPEDALFDFSVDGMRPFSAMTLELIMMTRPVLEHLLGEGTDVDLEAWEANTKEVQQQTRTKADLLSAWDESDALLAETWSRIPAERFHEGESAFNLPAQPNRDYVLYAVDNEIHHRAQGFVYLRLLGLEPPAFWER